MFTDCDVLLVAVAEKYRRQGIAKGLFGKLFDALVSDGGEKVFLEVRSRNRAARECYESLGFSEIGVRNNYYGDDDAVIIYKDDDCGFKRDMRRQRQNTAYAARLRSE